MSITRSKFLIFFDSLKKKKKLSITLSATLFVFDRRFAFQQYLLRPLFCYTTSRIRSLVSFPNLNTMNLQNINSSPAWLYTILSSQSRHNKIKIIKLKQRQPVSLNWFLLNAFNSINRKTLCFVSTKMFFFLIT